MNRHLDRRTVCHLVALVAGAGMAVGCGRAEAQPSAEQYIVACERAWVESTVTGETTALTRCLADDFAGLASSGKRYGKAAALSEARESPKEYRAVHLDEVQVRFFGNAAVAQGAETWERRTGEPRRGRWIWTDTWIRRRGQWQMVAATDVLVSGPPTPVAK